MGGPCLSCWQKRLKLLAASVLPCPALSPLGHECRWLGLAGIILDVHFPLVVYKKLLGLKPTFEVGDAAHGKRCYRLPQDALPSAAA